MKNKRNTNLRKNIFIIILIIIFTFLIYFFYAVFPIFFINYNFYGIQPILSSKDYNDLLNNKNYVLTDNLCFCDFNNSDLFKNDSYYFIKINDKNNEQKMLLYNDPMNYWFLNKNNTHDIISVKYANIIDYNDLGMITLTYYYLESNYSNLSIKETMDVNLLDEVSTNGLVWHSERTMALKVNNVKGNNYKLDSKFLERYEYLLLDHSYINSEIKIKDMSPFYSFNIVNEINEVLISITFTYNDTNNNLMIDREYQYEEEIINYIINHLEIINKNTNL